MSFANHLQNALKEEESSFQRPLAGGGPPQWSGGPDRPPVNASVNASVYGDHQIATSEAAAYLALKATAPGAQVSVARGRYKVMSMPYAKSGKLFVTLSDLGTPTTDRYTLVVPTDANILPKLIRQGSVRGQPTDITTATLKAEEVEEITIDGMPIFEYAGKYGGKKAGDKEGKAGGSLHMLRKKKEKKKEGKEEGEETDEPGLRERYTMGAGTTTGGAGRAMMLSMLRAKKKKEREGKKKKEKKKKEKEGMVA